jgi:uncharacterized membrane protein
LLRVRATALLILVALSFLAAVHAASQSYAVITVYYNGTVYAELEGVNDFVLFGQNVTDLRVSGSAYTVENGTIILRNSTYATVTYSAYFPENEIGVREPFNFTLRLVLPSSYSLVYSNPGPVSVLSSTGYYVLTFSGTEVSAAFSPSPLVTAEVQSSQGGNGPTGTFYLIAALIVTNSALAYLVYKLWREIERTRKAESVSGSAERLPPVGEGVQVERVEDEDEEAVSLEESELNDRDKQVLEAIRAGNKTLSDIVRATGLPKTTAYRRVKKLVKLGLVREVREKGRVVYETNDSGPTQS